ncbi:MAG: hypothetical protein LQ344_002443 [Seirophora lacunosa]|nr:MAG: hypothetical protein LQ344_002443 [Seirophora lacunosa]
MDIRAADCMNFIHPASLGVQPMNNEQYAAFFTPNIPMFKDFHLTAHDTIIDEVARKATMHLTSTATSVMGDYNNQYMVTIHMTEDGGKVDRFDEFADSKFSAEFFPKLREFMSQPLEADANGLWQAKTNSLENLSTSPLTTEQESFHTAPHTKAQQPHARLRLHYPSYSLNYTLDPPSSLRMSSIEHDHERETAELSADQTAIIDGSVGSDTETSKTFASDQASKDPSEGPHHARSNSTAKKPSTFKAVSVTKNFLAKAGTTAPPAAKGTADNPSASSATPINNASSVPRPRLVAKSAGGQQASAPQSAASKYKNGGGSGPDPLQVWNRNRGKHHPPCEDTTPLIVPSAAPPSAPKHFTDEELKQQYGIHLATRLQADGDGKEAKWADIDDDEDDWAPDTIEWNDGTKITLAENNAAAALAEEQAAAQALKEKQEAEAKAKAALPKPARTVGPNATVLKLGQAIQPKGGLVLKNPSEKPTLVAKPTTPAAVKSPWAPVPPVDKVPPVPINPPGQATQQRPQQSEQQRGEVMSPPPHPAMEIAADSFNRNRRDTPNAPPGQLFNSQSGQYEPVSTGRRGSVRKEQNFRPPSVLQRPSHSDARKPAEPSPAFQSNRAGGAQEVGVWTRRGSSTVSGDSGTLNRNASMSKGVDVPIMPDEMLQQRRDSQPLRSPALSNHQHMADPSSATASPQQQKAVPSGLQATSQVVDQKEAEKKHAAEREAQRKAMMEKRELAIKRRAEQEAKEEAEKKERIRIKLEKLGLEPLPDKNAPKTSAPAIKTSEDRGTATATKVEKNEVNESAPQADAAVPIAVSPPKPPMPSASGEPKQYGMMKVHGQTLTNGVTGHEATFTQDYNRDQALTLDATSENRQPPTHMAKAPMEPAMVNGDVSVKLPDTPSVQAPEQRTLQSKPSRQQPWSSLHTDEGTYKGWNGASMTTHSAAGGNLWGPPSNHRSLGNGTFDQSVQRSQSRQAPYQEHFKSPAPQPIGPPKSTQRSRQSPEAARAPEATSLPPIEDMQTIPTYPLTDSSAKPTTAQANSGTQISNAQTTSTAPQPPFASSSQLLTIAPRRFNGDDNLKLAAWGDFHLTSAREAEEKRRQNAQKEAARLAEEARTGVRHVPQLGPMQETWKQVTDQTGQRETVNVTKRQTHQQSLPFQQVSNDLRPHPFAAEPNGIPLLNVGRNSRFFPAHGHGFNPRAVSLPIGYYRQASPPPPDTADHPAYSGEGRPLVNLPISKPKPTVRLPPSTVTPTQSPVPAPVTTVPLRAISQPLVNNPSWQDRFNGLLGVSKRLSPERKFAQTVDFSASTKVPLDQVITVTSASVSLPPAVEESALAKEAGKATSKDVEDEEELFEDRGFGSVPQVSLPAKAPEGVGFVTATKPKRQTRTLKPVESESRRVFEPDLRENQVGEGLLIYISLPGMDRISKMIPRIKGQPSVQQGTQAGNQRQQRNVPNHPKPGRGPPKPRESSGHYSNSSKHSQGGSQRNTSQSNPGTQPRSHQASNRAPLPSWYHTSTSMHGKTGVLV